MRTVEQHETELHKVETKGKLGLSLVWSIRLKLRAEGSKLWAELNNPTSTHHFYCSEYLRQKFPD